MSYRENEHNWEVLHKEEWDEGDDFADDYQLLIVRDDFGGGIYIIVRTRWDSDWVQLRYDTAVAVGERLIELAKMAKELA